MRVENHDDHLPTALAVSVVLHLLLLWSLPDKPVPPPKDKVIEVTFLAEPRAGDKSAGPDADVGAPQKKPPPAPPQPRPKPKPAKISKPKAKPVPAAPKAVPTDEPAPAPSEAAEPATEEMPKSFAAWQASQKKGLPGLGKQRPAIVGLEGRGEDLARSRGTKRCGPRGSRLPDVLYLLIDSSGSMTPEWQSQALTCAHQYARKVVEAGGLVSVGNFAERTTFTRPSQDFTDIASMLRLRTNGHQTRLPGKELGPLLDAHANLEADLVVLSDGYLPNTREAMTWYRYFLKVNPENRGYLYTIGLAAPREVTDAFSMAGFDVLVYRLL